MAQEYRALVIDVKDKSVPSAQGQKWSQDLTTHMPTFTRDIKTPALSKETDLSAVVSGMPTIFARANLFKLAIDYIQDNVASDQPSDEAGLIDFYKNLIDEWRGFIGCIALDYTRISVRKIYLVYSDGKERSETSNLYEPKGAFGNMLFERKPLWMAQGLESNQENPPYIQVISYDGMVVGATSPDSLLFTSPGYKLSSQPFVNKLTGKFTDPLNSALIQDQAISLYAYVEYVISQLNKLADYYSKLDDAIRPNYSTLQSNLRSWLEEIRAYCDKRQYDLTARSVPPVDKFLAPFNLTFNFSSELWGVEGVIYDDSGTVPKNAIKFDPKKVLLPKNSEIAPILFNKDVAQNPNLLQNMPIFVLKAKIVDNDQRYAFFALPLTSLGLNVFGKNVGALVDIGGQGSAINSKMTATFDPSRTANNLEVTLLITTTTGATKPLKESYTVKERDRIYDKDIIMWPNFIAKDWNRYFLYSEMPHNSNSMSCKYRATPIVGLTDNEDFRIMTDDENDGAPVLLANEGKINEIPLKYKEILHPKLLVVSDDRVSDSDFKYEIYESDLPFKGVRLSSSGKESGYLIIHYSSTTSDSLPLNKLGDPFNPVQVSLGVDFGSTNTSVAFYANNQVHGLTLANRRVSLLKSYEKDRSFSSEKDVFFFSRATTESNAIKSMLALHNPRRLFYDRQSESTDTLTLGKEVKGGFPCFEQNLPIDSVTENRLKLKFDNSDVVDVVHNMKWSSQEIDKANKKAFLKTLLLQIYAELYGGEHGCYIPSHLKWSYPSSMSRSLVTQYSNIWEELDATKSAQNFCPIKDGVELTISASDIAGSGTGSIGFQPQGGEPSWPSMDGPSQESFEVQQQDLSLSDKSWGADAWGTMESDNGWPASDSAFPSKQGVLEDITPEENVKFSFAPIDMKKCMTEACAVANYMVSRPGNDITDRTITLCFDVGGSTTDISALIMTLNHEIVMVKQNSIRFAAQRVAQATKFSPNFKNVLLATCSQFKLRVLGLNEGPDKYSSETAPFYFEQIVDRLTPQQLPAFYQSISANCPEMMSVNLYVTGLIMYYAGQLANKLVESIRKGMEPHNLYANFKPQINVVFAGKGSRIFEWFSTTQQDNAQNYYQKLFINGMGGIKVAQSMLLRPPKIQLSQAASIDVKYEVSKGLAYNNLTHKLFVPKDMKPIEILGEDFFEITKPDATTQRLSFDSDVTAKMFEYIGTLFKQVPNPDPNGFSCQKFADFAGIFYWAAKNYFGFNMTQSSVVQGFRTMNINNYIMNMPEYRAAKAHAGDLGFDFVAPIIIIEGMKFYDDYLMKFIQNTQS